MPRPAGYQAEMGTEQTQSIWQTARIFPLLLLDCAKAENVLYEINFSVTPSVSTHVAPGMYLYGPHIFVACGFFRGIGNLSPVVSGMIPDTCLKGSSSSPEGQLRSLPHCGLLFLYYHNEMSACHQLCCGADVSS